MVRCSVCNRGLKNPVAIAKGIGPKCEKKLGFAKGIAQDEADGLQRPLAVAMQTDVRVWRETEQGAVHVNVPRCAIWHSPTGFECGYAGSGPADLALNILNAFVPPRAEKPSNNWEDDREDDPLPCFRGVTSRFAARHHQEFKRDFIQGMDRMGGKLEARRILEWIAAARHARAA